MISVADHERSTALRELGRYPGRPGDAMGVQDDRRDIVEWYSPGGAIRLTNDKESPVGRDAGVVGRDVDYPFQVLLPLAALKLSLTVTP
jgi:hypothetical protein